jgi:hypothetical protein
MNIIQKLGAVALSAAAIVFATGVFTQGAVAAERLFFEADMVRGVTQDGTTGPACVLTSQYKRRESVVWRVRVFDPAIPDQLDAAGLTSLAIQTPDGGEYKMHFGDHPRNRKDDSFWTVSWVIPGDYPLGTLSYKVVATDLEGKVHSWSPFNVGLSHLEVIPGDVTFTRR